MASTSVISVRVRKELKEKAEELGIDVNKVVTEALERAIEEKEMEMIKEYAEEAVEMLKDVTPEEWTRLVRESKNER